MAAAVRPPRGHRRHATIRVNGTPTTIVGVVPESVRHPLPADIWTLAPGDVPTSPVPSEGLADREVQYFAALARLAPGVTLSDANAQLQALGERLGQQFPDTNRGESFHVRPLADSLVVGRAGRTAGAAGRGRLRPADRLRQRRRPDARPRHGAAPRAGRPRVARREPLAAGAAADDREPRARGRRRRRGPGAGGVGRRPAGRDGARERCHGSPTCSSTGGSRRSPAWPPRWSACSRDSRRRCSRHGRS